MNKSTSVSLDDHSAEFVELQVRQGRFDNASDVMRAGLRLLEEQEASRAALGAALLEGENSGISTRSVADIWNAVKEEKFGTLNG